MDWAQVTKYALGIITAFYGVYATLTDFKEEKADGRKRLSKWGYLGICLLIITAVMSLGLDVHKDRQDVREKAVKDEADRIKRKEDLAQAQKLLDNLTSVSGKVGDQLQISKDSSDKLDQTQSALDRSFGLTHHIAGELGTQLNLSRTISGGLTGAISSLEATSKKTDAILREATESIGYFDVIVHLKIDPTGFLNEKGEHILSPEVLADFRENKQWEKVGTDLSERAVKELQSSYPVVRNKVLQDLFIISILDKKGRSIEQGLDGARMNLLGGTDHVVSFMIVPTSEFGEDDDTDIGVGCLITYRISPNRLSDITKFKDLNGAKWFAMIRFDPKLVMPIWLLLDVGQTSDDYGGGAAIFIAAKMPGELKSRQVGAKFSEDVHENYLRGGSVRIPADYFK
jgi:hypothetical protein